MSVFSTKNKIDVLPLTPPAERPDALPGASTPDNSPRNGVPEIAVYDHTKIQKGDNADTDKTPTQSIRDATVASVPGMEVYDHTKIQKGDYNAPDTTPQQALKDSPAQTIAPVTIADKTVTIESPIVTSYGSMRPTPTQEGIANDGVNYGSNRQLNSTNLAESVAENNQSLYGSNRVVPENGGATRDVGGTNYGSNRPNPDAPTASTTTQSQEQTITPSESKVEVKPVERNAESATSSAPAVVKGNIVDAPKANLTTTPDFEKVKANMTFSQYARSNPNISIAQAFKDYSDLRKKQGLPDADVLEYMTVLQNKDANKSIADNEREEKRRVRQERWQQIGNLLSHIGNFAGTLAGAPSQQLESGVQLTERQRKVRDAIVAQRKADGNNYINMVWKQRADERAKEVADADRAYKAGQLRNATAKTAADVELARKRGLLTDAQADKMRNDIDMAKNKDEREKALQPLKEQDLRAGISQKKASTAASYASAAKSNREDAEYNEWARNMEDFPTEMADFAKSNQIGNNPKKGQKQWTSETRKQANAIIRKKKADGRVKRHLGVR